ncbi:DUF397 domain-containing protein [Streptomyces sp. UNOC14_S4]|uniref:DUF397 domain-containing protein n=1 Tax=Streptomyces sp. UNOC14_S4 TaxID=2872340 RepID=UPI001E339788|nr:DUF397 domain-containing protein [Streptomyces sp. UNOC14_S4]MCC3770553.1 DUF397 domain-containing protein [Streptomyces sp. UNOC14_S4]
MQSRSSYSNAGQNCVEATYEPSWFKASYSINSGANCLSITALTNRIAVHDSKQPDGPAFAVPTTAWAYFTHET